MFLNRRLIDIAWYFIILAICPIYGCGPVISSKTRVEISPYNSSEYKQEKSGLVIESEILTKATPEFIATVQECNEYNQLLVEQDGRTPSMTTVIILPAHAVVYKIAVTNKTDHVIRLNSAVIRLFDPADNDYELLDKDSLVALKMAERPCPSTNVIESQLKILKLIGRNTELLPNITTKGYLIFTPKDPNLPGVVKLRMYEIPVETDAAGKVIKTEQFEIRTIVKKYIDTYQADSIFATPVKIDTKEIQ